MMESRGERCIPGSTSERIERDHLERYAFASQYAESRRVLDVACGVGYGSSMLLDAGAREVVGIDICAEAIEYANQHYRDERLKFLVEDCECYRAGKYQLIVSFETLEHLADGPAFLQNLGAMLQGGGMLIISTPNRAITSPMRSPTHPYSKWHKYEYTEGEFARALRDAGFSVIGRYGQHLYASVFRFEPFTRVYLHLNKPVSNADASVRPLRGRTAKYLVFLAERNR